MLLNPQGSEGDAAPGAELGLLQAAELGAWQRFATKWAIVFTDSSHPIREKVRLLRRNATSTAHAEASRGPPDIAHEAGFFSVFCGVPASGLISAKANRGRVRRLIANPIPIRSGVGERS